MLNVERPRAHQSLITFFNTPCIYIPATASGVISDINCNGRCASSRVRVDYSLTSRRVELVRRNKREDIFYGQL